MDVGPRCSWAAMQVFASSDNSEDSMMFPMLRTVCTVERKVAWNRGGVVFASIYCSIDWHRLWRKVDEVGF